MRTLLGGTLVLVLLLPAAVSAQPKPAVPFKVFVTVPAADAGSSERAALDRALALKDVRRGVGSRTGWLQIVERAADAEITLEVQGRSIRNTGRKTLGTIRRDILEYRISTELRAGDVRYPISKTATDEVGSGGQWLLAGMDVGAEAEKWVKKNGAQLRTTPPPPSAPAVEASPPTAELEKAAARARDATVRAKMRTLAAAQFTFSSIAGGAFAPLDCLEKPRACMASAPAEPLLPGTMDVQGYTGVFTPGPAATAAGATRVLKEFAYVMTPQSGDALSYCTDATARLCSARGKIVATGGKCPATCVDVP